MSTASKGAEFIALGDLPRVHLLPPEVEGQRKTRALRRTLLLGLAAAVVVAIVAIGGVSLVLAGATAVQQQEQAKGLLLTTQLKKYSSVTGVQNQLDAITASQPVGVSGEILWEPFIASLQATLPAGTSITSFIAKLNSAADDSATAVDPLNGDHVATVSVTAVGPQDSLTAWLSQLPALQGVVSSTPGDVSVSADPGIYVAKVDLNLSKDIVAERFKTGATK